MKGYVTLSKIQGLEHHCLLSCPGHSLGLILPLCRDAIGVYYSFRRIGYLSVSVCIVTYYAPCAYDITITRI